MKRPDQLNLFAPEPKLPEGFVYREAFLSPGEEQELVREIARLPFESFQFHSGLVGKRRVVSFGWRYDFGGRRVQKADDMPAFLLPLRGRAAVFAGLESASFQHVLVTEYAPGAGIGWHK